MGGREARVAKVVGLEQEPFLEPHVLQLRPSGPVARPPPAQ